MKCVMFYLAQSTRCHTKQGFLSLKINCLVTVHCLLCLFSYAVVRGFVSFLVLVFVRVILSWCPRIWHIYIVYNIFVWTSLQFILYINVYLYTSSAMHVWRCLAKINNYVFSLILNLFLNILMTNIHYVIMILSYTIIVCLHFW